MFDENSSSDPLNQFAAQSSHSPPGSGFEYKGPPILSALAITSTLFAVISPVAFCVCGLSLLKSIVAILTGHIALVRIKNSAGQLAGHGMAMFGVILGYLMFGISLAFVIFWVSSIQKSWRLAQEEVAQAEGSTSISASSRLRDAEMDVLSATDGYTTGNSETAVELAEVYSGLMKEMRDTLYTEGDQPSALTDGEFVTHCELHENRCAFIVHAPDYRKFDDDAKESLATVGWIVAQRTVKDALQPGDQLAVGLRGTVVYGAVLIGKVATEEDVEEPVFARRKREDLLPFFSPSFSSSSESALPAESELDRTQEPSPADRPSGTPDLDSIPDVTPEPAKPAVESPAFQLPKTRFRSHPKASFGEYGAIQAALGLTGKQQAIAD